MALSADRIITPGQTPHAHERDAFDFVVKELPDSDPYQLWAFVDLNDSSSGRRYDLDLLVLGYHALYLVEIKSHPGVLTGDEVDWTVTFPDKGRTTFENPLRTTTHKARVLSSLLDKKFSRDHDANQRGIVRPWVQPLVFLSGDLKVNLTSGGRVHVVTRDSFRTAITRGEFPGSPERLRERFVNRPAAGATVRILKDLGLRPSIKAIKVGDLILRQLLEDGSHYQDHLGVHQSVPSIQRRVRSFSVPANTTAERRDQLLRAAKREAQILTTLSDHPNVLRLVDYATDGPLGGPCVILDHLEGALSLDVFLRANPDLSFEDRIAIIQQIAEGLEFCHRKQITHRGLSPRSILVRRAGGDRGAIEVRLYNFQLASAEDTSGTAHISSLSPEQAAVYVAPELRENPAAADAVSDVFSLGAVAYHVLTNQPPGGSLAEREALLSTGHLSVAAARDALAGGSTARSLEKPLETAFTAEGDDGTPRLSSLDEVVGFATERNRHARADSPIAWLNLLLDAATTPAAQPDAAFVSPLDAAPGQRIADDLEVVAVLGSGSTARVLRVRRGNSEYALKVAHAPDLEDRLRQEASILRALQKKSGSDRVVSLVEELTLSDRTCLLMTDAGETLAALIAREGPPSLDFARRWGEDLLKALENLEDQAIQHRDIKPANLGVLPSQAKKKRNLMLFDFSLAGAADGTITAGTPAYRDPFIERRGKWDAAADRWSAAMTLHELLTGVRPGWGAGDETAAASDGEIRIAAERFDASGNVRPKLTAFFRKALARDATDRFENADTMCVAWIGCFASLAYGESADDGATPAPAPDFAALDPKTPIAALPLSARAKNALDRAGMTVLAELLQMPRNRLSTTRGIGRQTHQEIQKFADDARAALGQKLDASAQAPFFGDFASAGFVASIPGFSSEAAAALEDAGLGSLTAAATAPGAQVERVLAPYPGATDALRGFLQSGGARPPSDSGPPATIEDWLDQLFDRRGKGEKYLQTAAQLLGLEETPGQSATDARDARGLAQLLGISPAAVYIAFGKARERWKKHPHVGDLHARLAAILGRLEGVASLARIAEELSADIPHRNPAAATSVTREALARIAAETSDELISGRIHQRLWLAEDQVRLALARALGDKADDLAALSPLPSSDEAREALQLLVKDTLLVGLTHDRLITLAADASKRAARSARLELYPRDLEARRALELSATAIPLRQATPDAVRKIVHARYPEAPPLPEGDALHALVQSLSLGFKWDPAQGCYIRPGAEQQPSLETRVQPRRSTTHTSHRATGTQENQEAKEFEARLRLAVEKPSFRVLDISAGYDDRAAEEIAGRFGGRVVSLEAEMLGQVSKLVTEWEVDVQVIEEADRQGPAAPEEWENLRRLMREAAERAIRDALAGETTARPVVLTQPGMLARYDLADVLGALVERAQRDDAPPIFLINPTDEQSEWARIDSSTKPLMVPVLSPAQRLKVPQAWAENAHRAGAR